MRKGIFVYAFSLLLLEIEKEEGISIIKAEEPLIITEFLRYRVPVPAD